MRKECQAFRNLGRMIRILRIRIEGIGSEKIKSA